MNEYKRNVVIVGLSKDEKESLNLKDIKELNWQDKDITHRFPHLIFVDTLEEALKHQGFLLITPKDYHGLDNYTYEKKYRYKYKNYYQVYFINKGYAGFSEPLRKIKEIGMTQLRLLNNERLLNSYLEYINLQKSIEKFTKKRNDNIEKLNNYLKNKKEVTIEEVQKDLNMSYRSVKRYMIDLYNKYQTVIYDPYKKKYFYTK